MSGDHGHGCDCGHEHAHEPDAVDLSGWLRDATTQTCPSCGAAGALRLGGGIFCPACAEVATNPGYTPPGG